MTDERRSLRAWVLRHSPRVQDREESERIFRKLRDSAQAGVAHLSLELPESIVYETPRRENPALTEMSMTWMGLRSPMHPQELDYRFERWFADAEHQPELLEQFAPRMVASATDWLAEYERVSNVVSAADEPRLRHFDAWAELAGRYPAVAAALSEILDRWAVVRSKRRIDDGTRRVETAMDRGDVTAAWNELRELAELPDVSAAKIEELRDAIRSLAMRQAEIDAWLTELAGAPATWNDVARMYELWAKGRRLAQARGTPRESAESIARALEGVQASACEFIARRAEKWTALDEIRSDVAILRDASRGREAVVDETWLEALSSSFVRLIDRSIENADGAGALRRVSASAAAIAAT
ncbi:MAG TPA: hypothetical protein VFP80_11440, partial [Thermoanaerobaculia bacterium]|nr:hypothetical protein [Thermoanaerobaculia bacterium]